MYVNLSGYTTATTLFSLVAAVYLLCNLDVSVNQNSQGSYPFGRYQSHFCFLHFSLTPGMLHNNNGLIVISGTLKALLWEEWSNLVKMVSSQRED